jgi:hypothetical protein
VPANSVRASIRISEETISRWFVGSSMTMKFPGFTRIFARQTLALSPPERTATGFSTSGPEKRKAPHTPADKGHGACVRDDLVDFFENRLVGVEHFREVLCVVTHAHFMTQVDFPVIR